MSDRDLGVQADLFVHLASEAFAADVPAYLADQAKILLDRALNPSRARDFLPMQAFAILELTVPGEAVPWARAGRGRQGQSYTPKRYLEWRTDVAERMVTARRGGMSATPIGLIVVAYRKSRRHVDADNVLKACADAGNGVAWADDDLIRQAFVRMVHVEEDPRVEILAYRLAGLEEQEAT